MDTKQWTVLSYIVVPQGHKSTSSFGLFRNHAGDHSVTLLLKHIPVTCLSQARVWLRCHLKTVIMVAD